MKEEKPIPVQTKKEENVSSFVEMGEIKPEERSAIKTVAQNI